MYFYKKLNSGRDLHNNPKLLPLLREKNFFTIYFDMKCNILEGNSKMKKVLKLIIF